MSIESERCSQFETNNPRGYSLYDNEKTSSVDSDNLAEVGITK